MSKPARYPCDHSGCGAITNLHKSGKCALHRPRASCEWREPCTRGKKKGSLYCLPHMRAANAERQQSTIRNLEREENDER